MMGIVLCVAGILVCLLLIAAAVFNWEWAFFDHEALFLTALLGQTGMRLVCALVGGGFLVAFVAGFFKSL